MQLADFKQHAREKAKSRKKNFLWFIWAFWVLCLEKFGILIHQSQQAFWFTFPRPYPFTSAHMMTTEKINPYVNIRCWFILFTLSTSSQKVLLNFTGDLKFTIAMHPSSCRCIYRQIQLTFLSITAFRFVTRRETFSRATKTARLSHQTSFSPQVQVFPSRWWWQCQVVMWRCKWF